MTNLSSVSRGLHQRSKADVRWSRLFGEASNAPGRRIGARRVRPRRDGRDFLTLSSPGALFRRDGPRSARATAWSPWAAGRCAPARACSQEMQRGGGLGRAKARKNSGSGEFSHHTPPLPQPVEKT
jgi:hypothetical protein